MRRSALLAIASRTSASSCASRKLASHPSATAPAAAPCAVHLSGSVTFGIASLRTSADSGGGRSAQPAAVAIRTRAGSARCTVASVQLEDQVIRVGPDPDDHLADDVDGGESLGVDRRAARGARREERLAVLLREVELHYEAPGRLGEDGLHRQRAALPPRSLGVRPAG